MQILSRCVWCIFSNNSDGKFCFWAVFIAVFAPFCAEKAWKSSAYLGTGMPEGEVQREGYSS